MIVTPLKVFSLRVADVPRLDPIDLHITDTAPGAGKITLDCFGKSWTAWWGAMGAQDRPSDVVSFIRSASVDYLVNCLDRGITSTVYAPQAVQTGALRDVLERRRARELTKTLAHAEYEKIAGLHLDDDPWSQPDVLRDLLGDDWVRELPMEPNPDYVYLSKIVTAVQDALRRDLTAPAAMLLK